MFLSVFECFVGVAEVLLGCCEEFAGIFMVCVWSVCLDVWWFWVFGGRRVGGAGGDGTEGRRSGVREKKKGRGGEEGGRRGVVFFL